MASSFGPPTLRAKTLLSALTLSLLSVAACGDEGASTNDDGDTKPGKQSSSGQTTGGSSGTSGGAVDGESFAEAPSLQEIEPNRATVGEIGPTIVVRGRNFVPRTVVQLDGAELATSFVDPTELRAIMPTERLAEPGVLLVSVGTSPPGGGASSATEFTVENPVPTLTRVSTPSTASAPIGSPTLTIQLQGSGFVAGSKVRWQGEELPTTVTSRTTISAQVDASKLTSSGVFEIDVLNPAPGGGPSAQLTFVVTNPTVQLASIEPASANVGSSDVTLTLKGGGFVAGRSKVIFHNVELTPTVLSATEMTAVVPAARLATVGAFTVVVQNPDPGGGTSLVQFFSVVNPSPRLTSLTPSSVLAGSSSTQVIVRGTNFAPDAAVTLRGSNSSTLLAVAQRIGTDEIRVTVPADRLTTGGTFYDLRVENPGPGGGTSSLPFNVRNPGAVIDNAYAQSSDGDGFLIGQQLVIQVDGSGFLGNSQIQVAGATVHGRTFVNAARLQATITPNQAALSVTVTSPDHATSNAIALTACNRVNGPNNVPAWTLPQVGAYYSTVGALFNANAPYSGSARSFTGNTGQTCGNASTRNDLRPFRAVVVQNTSGRGAVIEAWGICSGSTDDAYLALYPGSTLPGTTDAQKRSCTGVVSNGHRGNEILNPWYSIQNTGASNYCPGLWGTEGGVSHGAPQIAACGTYVAYIQAYYETTNHPQGMTVGLWPQ